MLNPNIGGDEPDPQPVFDTYKAVDFLVSFVQTGRIAVAEIDPDAPGCTGTTFTLPFERQRLFDWIEERQGRRNLYFTASEPKVPHEQRGANGRCGRDDIEMLRVRDIERARRALQGKRALTLSAMRELENAAWVVTMDFSAEGPSRWRVNPQIHTRFSERAAREKAQRAEARRKLVEAGKAQRRLSRD